MTYIDKYKARLNAEGATPGDAYANATINVINDSFTNAPNYKNILIDSLSTDVRIMDVKASSQGNQILSFVKELLFRPNTVRRRGSYAVIDGQSWLLFDFRAGITPKAVTRLCNEILTIQTGVTEILKGYDAMNRPVYEKTPITKSWACVADTKAFTRDNPLNSSINLPDGTLSIVVQYTTEIVESEDAQFTMWGQKYKITNINYEYVVNDEGPMVITAQRVV